MKRRLPAGSVFQSAGFAPRSRAKWLAGVAVLGLCLLFVAATRSPQVAGISTPTGGAQPPAVRDKKTPTYTTIDAPGAGTSAFEGTLAISINTAKDITGFYIDSGIVAHGFVRSGLDGSIAEFDAPGAGSGKNEGTFPASINTKGVIAGSDHDASDVYHGFVRAVGGTITMFDAPGAGTTAHRGTTALSINASGAITGVYNDAGAARHGFVRASKKGTITTFDVPGAGTGYTQGTIPFSINTAGTIAGVYSDASSVFHGFVRTSAGAISTFDVPGALGTIPFGINTAGSVTGTYDTSSGCQGFMRTATGTITTFNAPGAGTGTCMGKHIQLPGTIGTNINTAGDITGLYEDSSGVFHAFELVTKTNAMTPFDVPGAGSSGMFQGSVGVGINNAQDIAGVYSDSSNVFHGFLRTPK